MEAFRIVFLLQALICSGASQNLPTPKSPEGNKEYNLSVSLLSRPCSWMVTMRSSGDHRSAFAFLKDSLKPLAERVCETLGCGGVYDIRESSAEPNASCFRDCVYDHHHNNPKTNSSASLLKCRLGASGECTALNEVICDTAYVTPLSDHCVFNISFQKSSIILTKEAELRLSREICQKQGCGEPFPQETNTAPPNSTCLSDCVYNNSQLHSCSTELRSDCSLLSRLVCGDSVVRLSGGSHRCAGRVELWRDGQWGTVCDDQWDKLDADVVCAQMGCGYAISVTGQNDQYSHGGGPIFLDELNCTGTESSLWGCPAVKGENDCGHKEDAGVVCSEYKALRLTGGLDRCSGRVESHRNGLWGTVCEDLFQTEEASMVCSMLDCGSAVRFLGFNGLFTHNNVTRWFYWCGKVNTSLWDCRELNATSGHLCKGQISAGVICENSLGIPVATSPQATTALSTTVQMTTAAAAEGTWSLELLGCIGLSAALLLALMVNIILCCRAKRRKTVVVQQMYPNLQSPPHTEENTYRDSIHLVKVTSNDNNPNVAPVSVQMWTQSSVDSADTDYDPNDCVPDPAFPLSTFRNSLRYSAEGRAPGPTSVCLQSVCEEDVPGHTLMPGYQHQTFTVEGLSAAPSEDSFETSSTSSGECYENTGLNAHDLESETYGNTGEYRGDLQTGALLNPVPCFDSENYTNQIQDSYTNHSNGLPSNQGLNIDARLDCEDDSEIYSPVSADVDLHSDSDYDDVTYLQA
ncbi:T-cell differentiation antigen CD6-like [Hoplias malabaricus]|uniref:T-cell differentiation antigen CD6-like n=1 Tax=Hoplias malabaricus TaxID=27720 RepID=UPI0034633017